MKRFEFGAVKAQSLVPTALARFGMRRAIGAAFLAALVGASHAQVRDEGQRLLMDRQEKSRSEALETEQPRVAGTPASPDMESVDPTALAEEEPAFVVREIELKGDSFLAADEREALLRPFIALRLGQRRIDLLLRRITAAYMARGLITTRAYLAPQNLSSGRLEITVVPGKLEAVRLNNDVLAGTARAAMPEAADGVLRLPDVEQTVDQINRLRSQHAEAQILPGQSPGGSVVELTNRPESPWRASLGADTYGQPSTGQGRVRYGIEVDDLLGAWDAWSVSHVEAKDSRADLLTVSVPLGYGTFSYAFAQSAYRTPIGTFAVSTGSSRNQTLAWNHVLQRDSRGRTAMDASLALRESWRRLNNVELSPQQQAALCIALSRQQRLSVGSVSGEVGISRGLDAFSFDRDAPGLPDAGAHNQFRKTDVSLATLLAVGADFAWRANLSAQWAQVGLPGAEQIFAGGASTVRGFQEGAVVGDRGYVFRNELQWTGELTRTGIAGAQFVPFLLADVSHTRLLADADSKRLSSIGAGVSLAWKYASLDAAWARPLAASDGVLKADRLHASLSFQF
ncbi:MAG: ShlB/FhaC/HecB family hemolysin secretion/activation protein [Ignavibacteria bacterium]